MQKLYKAKMMILSRNLADRISGRHSSSRIYTKFCKKAGLVYLGSVDQKSDEHEIIRGFTVSESHKDDSYAVGSVNGYDVAIIERTDALWGPGGKISVEKWTIMSIKLKTKQDLPHFFIEALGHHNEAYSPFFMAYPTIGAIHLGALEKYSTDFTSRFKLCSRPNMAIKTERLIPASAARIIAAHFWPLSVEQNEHVLYIYSNGQKISSSLLERMLEDILWLAAHLDRQAELV